MARKQTLVTTDGHYFSTSTDHYNRTVTLNMSNTDGEQIEGDGEKRSYGSLEEKYAIMDEFDRIGIKAGVLQIYSRERTKSSKCWDCGAEANGKPFCRPCTDAANPPRVLAGGTYSDFDF